MRARLTPLLLLLAAACSSDFLPRSYLADLRVLALVAEPPEIGFAESTTVAASTWPVDWPDQAPPSWPAGWTATRTWSFCPYSVGSSAGYACIVPECEQPLPGGASATVAPQPLALAFAQCVQARVGGGGGGISPGLPGSPPARVEAIVRYRVEVKDAAGSLVDGREAVLRLPVTTPDPPSPRNANPVIAEVAIGGEVLPLAPPGKASAVLVRGAKLEVRVRLDAPQPAPGGGAEASVISFFTTDGRFDYDRALGPEGSVELEGKDLVPGVATAHLFVVARDLRGGQAVAGPFDVEVRP